MYRAAALNTNKTVKFVSTAKGRRAYRAEGLRWFPMPLAEAEYLVATGAAKVAKS